MVGLRWMLCLVALGCVLESVLEHVAVAEPAAVVATDVPVTVGETMQDDASLADVTFVDRQRGWAVGDRGVIWHTSDGGTTWQLQRSGVSCNLTSVSFIDAAHGWAAGGATRAYSDASQATLLVTADGGATWSEIEQPTLPAITNLKFFDAKRGMAAGDSSAVFSSGVFATGDGGRTWRALPTQDAGQWLAADFPDPQTGAVAGANGQFGTLMRRHVVRSPSAVASSRAYRALRLAPPTAGWLVGDGGLVMLTTDLGHSWQTPPGALPDYVATNFDFQAVAIAGPHVWIAGSPGTRVFHSADGGHSWTSQPTGQNLPLRTLRFLDERTGFAVGDLGTILATEDGGRHWRLLRRGGERAALLVALARETDVPLELLAKYGAEEGYLAAVSLLHSERHTSDARSREAMLLAGATAAKVATQFSAPRDAETLTLDELIASLGRSDDGNAARRLEQHLTRELRIWRPDVVVTHFVSEPESAPLAALVERAVDAALRAAADPSAIPELQSGVGLPPWRVKAVYGVLPAGWRGEDRITTGQFAPRLGATLADWVEPARRVLHSSQTITPETVDLQCKAASRHSEPQESHGLFAGLKLAPGGDARRRLANLPGEDVARLRQLATRRRQMRMLIERSQGNAAWAGQVVHLTDDLDSASAGELLFELAEGYRAVGKLDLAADTFTLLARRQPEHPLVEPALRWLVQFYSSGEAAQRLADRGAENYRQLPAEESPATAGVTPASAMLQAASAPVTGLSRDQRLERATALGQYLEHSRPALYAEPSVRFPLVVGQRELGFANPAQRYYLTLRSLGANDPWRRCAQTEEWFDKPGDSPPPKTLGHCRRTSERPHLDGKLDEPLWEGADRLSLRESSETESQKKGTDKIDHPTVRFACDDEFLYVAAQCPRSPSGEYSADDRPRTRDADLTAHDRISIRLDVDRDYTTAYELTFDCRGWTHDACWNDATWNPKWFVAAKSDESSWSTELAIPLAELVQERPAARQVWAASIVRTIPRVGDETWSGDAAAEDSPEKFGLLIFE